MKVTNRYNQLRRDLTIDLKCENCGYEETDHDAYDDRNFWDNVIPARKCKECSKSSNDLGSDKDYIQTKYPEGMQV